MSNRFKDGSTFLEGFATRFLVYCPKCENAATVVPSSDKLTIKCSCFNCGFVKELSSSQHDSWITTSKKIEYIHIASVRDWYFHYPLWLSVSCCGEELWAYNGEHLDFLKAYIHADLRGRKKDKYYGWHNGSLASRLPKWLKLSKNRDEVS